MFASLKHFLFLALVGIIPVCMLYAYFSEESFLITLVISMTCYTICFWGQECVSFFLKKIFPTKKSIPTFYLPLLSLVFLPAALPFAYKMASLLWPQLSFGSSSWSTGIAISFACIGLVSLWIGILQFQLRAKQSEVDLMKVKFSALNSQLNPHFLFNVLNSLVALIEIDPLKARDMVIDIADLLREFLLASGKDFHSVDHEIKIAEHYISIQKHRFPKLTVEWKVDKALLDMRCPTLILQPLLENAIKYGSGMIKVFWTIDDGFLTCTVENTLGQEELYTKGAGISLRNLETRLFLLLGSKATLTAERSENHFITKIAIPLGDIRP
jgi:hypothetical protein